jgi:hypothetical protein
MNDRLSISNRGNQKPPGAGPNERVTNVEVYSDLAAAKDWRQVLTVFWTADHVEDFIVFRGRTYRSHSHAFQAAKFEVHHPQVSWNFCVESGSEIGTRGSGWEANCAGKSPALTPGQLQNWCEARERRATDEIYAVKFRPGSLAARILLATKSAELYRVGLRGTAVRCGRLERIRASLAEAASMPFEPMVIEQ